MSIFTSISNHSKRGYYALQGLFSASALTLAWSILTFGNGGRLTWALAFCIAVNLIAILGLVYVQRTMGLQLEAASAAQEETARLTRTDTLTGATTRGHFLAQMQQSLGSRLARRHATLIVVDIDHFKQLNDSLGHPFGDAALNHVVCTMKRLFPDAVVGRLGGDEFAILVRNGDVQMAIERANRLIETLRGGVFHSGNNVALSVSMGIALAPLHATQTDDLMLLADLALYESKSAGRGRVTVFDNGMLSDKRHRRFIQRELRAAIYLNELELHYQPMANADGTVYALEGLVRWRHPVRGIIAPGEFISIAEESNLIDMLGAWVFRRACADIPSFPGCRISINVSGEQLKRDEFIAMLARVLEETGRSADGFVLEITETVATAATPEVLRRLETVREMGFRVALDDFGTGFCGFNYLKTLPIDAIKIDRSYIQSLAEDEVARVFVSALAQIARIQNLVILAEGVETETDLTLARAAGCTCFQGYLLARPAPKDKLAHLFDGDAPRLALAS